MSLPAQRQSLSSLSADIITCIFTHCGVDDLLSCSLVCRRVRNILESNVYLLRYKVLLAVHGLIDAPSRRENKLSLLVTHHSHFTSGLYTSGGSRYLTRVGIYPRTFTTVNPTLVPTIRDGEEWQLSLAFGGTISCTITKPLIGVIDVYDLSCCPGDRRSAKHWAVPLEYFPGVKTWAVSVDTTQDLLLVARGDPYGETGWNIAVHVRSLQRPESSHPRTRLRLLHTASSTLNFQYMSNIQIHCEYVVWMLGSQTSVQTEVWNWHTGEKLWMRTFDKRVTYTILDDAHILLTSDHWEELRVYRFNPPDDTPKGILRLGLPATQPCTYHIQQSSIPVPPPNAPFWPDPELRIVMVAYWYKRSVPPPGALLIPYTTFRRQLYPPFTEQASSATPTRIEWGQWGAPGSVDVHIPVDKRVVPLNSYPYGSQVSFHVAKQPGGRLSPNWWKRTDLVTVDINPYAEKYARNPYVACPPRATQWTPQQVKTWTGDSTFPHTISSVSRHEENVHLWNPKLITHPRGYAEMFLPCYGDSPDAFQEIGFRTYFSNGDGDPAVVHSASSP